jgi:hypothetical protein
MRRAALLLLCACPSAPPRPQAAEVEVLQIQLGWNTMGKPYLPPIVDVNSPARDRRIAEAQARQLLERCEKGEPFEPLVRKYSEADPAPVKLDARSGAPFRDAALGLKPGECGLAESQYGWHVLKRVR